MLIKNILGKQVLPLLIKGRISGHEADKVNGNAGKWLNGKERQLYYRRAVKEMEKEELKDNKEMDWFVFAICADDTFILRSNLGYERSGISRNEFRLIKITAKREV